MVLEGAIDLAGQMPEQYTDEVKVKEWEEVYEAVVLAMTEGIIKPFDEAPDVLSKATPENWSLGSLQYLLTAGLGLPKRIHATTINKTLEAEEVMRHRFPASGSVACSSSTEWFICAPMCPITAFLGNRNESLAIASSFAREYMLPPFYITTEVRAETRKYGHYMTNWGASLSSIVYGMTGLQMGTLGSDPTGWGGERVAALPLGWDTIEFGAWLGGKRYGVKAEHGARLVITLKPPNADLRGAWRSARGEAEL